MMLALTSNVLPLYGARRVRRDDDRAAALDGGRGGAGRRVRRAEVRGARAARPRPARDPRHQRQPGRQRDPGPERPRCPTGVLYGRDQTLTVPATGQLAQRGAVPPADRRLPATARRCGWATWATCSTTSRTTRAASWYNADPGASSLAVTRQPGTNTVDVARRGEGGAGATSSGACRRTVHVQRAATTGRSRSRARCVT